MLSEEIMGEKKNIRRAVLIKKEYEKQEYKSDLKEAIMSERWRDFIFLTQCCVRWKNAKMQKGKKAVRKKGNAQKEHVWRTEREQGKRGRWTGVTERLYNESRKLAWMGEGNACENIEELTGKQEVKVEEGSAPCTTVGRLEVHLRKREGWNAARPSEESQEQSE